MPLIKCQQFNTICPKVGLIIANGKQKHKSGATVFQFSQAFLEPWTIKQHFELTNNPKTKALLSFWHKHSKPGGKHINSSIYLYRAHAPAFPSLYCVATRTHTYRAVSKHGKLNSKHRLWPIYLPVILLSLQTKPGKTNSNSHTSDETLLISHSHSFRVSFHMCLDRHIFIRCNYCTHEEKVQKKKQKRIKEEFLAEQDWICTACSVSGNQELYPLMLA